MDDKFLQALVGVTEVVTGALALLAATEGEMTPEEAAYAKGYGAAFSDVRDVFHRVAGE
jgi:hypothetical protein